MAFIKTAAAASIILGLSSLTFLIQSSKTEFTIAASSDYTIEKTEQTKSNIKFEVIFIYDGQTANEFGLRRCGIEFTYSTHNKAYSKDEINKFSKADSRKKYLKEFVGKLAKVLSHQPVTLQGYTGHELTIELKEKVENERLKGIMVMIETKQGRMIQTCVAKFSDFEKVMPEFKKITQSISLPE